jgi:pimeloyl-ACP methyl ester carboxylesterase
MISLRTILLLTILILSSCNLQERMLYFPSHNVPDEKTLSSQGLRFWPVGRDGYRGFVDTGASPAGNGTIVVFHGNAGAASDRDYYLAALRPLGFRVLLAEYPGYGGRQGRPGERTFVQDAHETLRLVAAQYGRPLYLLGESLGCGVAAAAAKDSPVPIDGIILITPWDTLRSVAKDHYPWLPLGLLLHDTYDSVGNLKNYAGPVAVIGAERDDVIPLRHAQALYDALPARKKMWTVASAGHNDWPLSVRPAWWKEITDFIRSATAPPSEVSASK